LHLKLTDLALQRLPIGTHWDETTPAFGVRVGKRAKTFFCIRDGGRRITIGRYPSMKLVDARIKAKGLLLGVYEKRTAPGYLEAVESYLKQVKPDLKLKTYSEYARILRRMPFITVEVSPSEIASCLEQIPKASTRAHAYAALKTFFNWSMRNEYCESNPVTRVRPPKKLAARERVLEDHELKAIWHACDKLGGYGTLVRLLMVTGQRKGQFARLQEEWVDFKHKRFAWPGGAMKAGQPHTLPFSTLAEYLVRKEVPIDGFYFTPLAKIGQPFTAWSKNKAALDKLVDLDHWTLHDLRRTWSTNAARLDVPPHITERVLAHVAPEGKVASIYNRFKYENEMRDAMQTMADFVASLLVEVNEEIRRNFL